MNQADKVLTRLHEDARNDSPLLSKISESAGEGPSKPEDYEEVYIPISKEQGDWIRSFLIEKGAKTIVEFGTSFGISTIYLADAARQTGGQVITTELLESKAQKATKNLEDAEVMDYVDLRIGDAMQTLKAPSEPIDFLLLDGWKDLYVPLFQLLEPRFHSGTWIYADNMDMENTADFARHLKNHSDKYVTEYIHDGKACLSKPI
jgi:predicted O-methyltransferase YrrM